MSKKPLKNGLYYAYAPDYKPQLVDAHYNGFRIVYVREMNAADRAPNIIKDSIAPMKSMADGKTYDSKSRYYESLKRADCRIVEKGEYNPEKPHYGARVSDAAFDCKKELKQAIQQHLG